MTHSEYDDGTATEYSGDLITVSYDELFVRVTISNREDGGQEPAYKKSVTAMYRTNTLVCIEEEHDC